MTDKTKKKETSEKIIKAKQAEVRYKNNPFLDELRVETKSRSIRITSGGSDAGDAVLMTSDGEVRQTAVVTHREVDSETFVKSFTAGIASVFNLNSSGFKALQVLYWVMQETAINRDIVQLNKYTHDDFKDAFNFPKFSKATFDRGLKELEATGVIARAEQRGFFFINPAICWNGNRYTFTQSISKKAEAKAKQIKDINDANNAQNVLDLEGLGGAE